jgi:membrane protease YdiL (CAAX protease family)
LIEQGGVELGSADDKDGWGPADGESEEPDEEGFDVNRPDTRSPGDKESPDRQGFVRMALLFYGVMGCIALIWRMFASPDSILAPGGPNSGVASGILGAAFAGLVVGLASVGISEWLTRGTKLGEQLADLLGESLAGITPGDAFLLALASGVAEEMFFRGALQPAVGIVWASLAFGACHFLPRRELAIWSLYAVAMGFAFGWLFEWTGSLLAPIVAHTVVNGINLPRLASRYEERSENE